MDRLTDVLIERLLVDETDHVLDVGCGVGGPGLRVVESTGARLTGISISEEQVKTANRLAEEAWAVRTVRCSSVLTRCNSPSRTPRSTP